MPITIDLIYVVAALVFIGVSLGLAASNEDVVAIRNLYLIQLMGIVFILLYYAARVWGIVQPNDPIASAVFRYSLMTWGIAGGGVALLRFHLKRVRQKATTADASTP